MEAHSTEVTLEAEPGLAGPITAPFSQYGREDWRVRRRRVPWTIGKYVGMEAIRTVILCILLISLLYCAMVTFQTIRSGIQFAFIWPFLIKTFAYPLFFSLPLALLAGVTLAYGRMTADLEVAAIRYHGASHLQMFGPVLVLASAGAGAGAALVLALIIVASTCVIHMMMLFRAVMEPFLWALFLVMISVMVTPKRSSTMTTSPRATRRLLT